MKPKTEQLVITFHTTADAMALEAACQRRSAPGRMIPVPRSVSAGCGMAWCAGTDDREQLVNLIEEEKIEIQEIHTCLL